MAVNWKIVVATALLVLGVLSAREGLRKLPEDELARFASIISQQMSAEITHGHGRPGTVSATAKGTQITVTRTGAPDYGRRNVITHNTPFTIVPEDISKLIHRTCHSQYNMVFTRMGGSARLRYVGADGQPVSILTLDNTLCLGHWLTGQDEIELRERAAFVLALSLVLAFALALIQPRAALGVRITAAVALSWVILSTSADWPRHWSWDKTELAAIATGTAHLTYLLPAVIALFAYLALAAALVGLRSVIRSRAS